jgi:uncharacterized protein
LFERNDSWDSKFALRTINYQRSVISNICDYELVGREVRNGDHIISLSREYFLEELIGHSEARNILQASSMLNLVGNRIIKLAIEMRLAKEMTVRNIQGIPFLMIFKFRHFD